jgi:hypothetical protein
MNTVELNNEYRSLQVEEEEEIQRILAALSGQVADHGDTVKRVVERMAELGPHLCPRPLCAVLDASRPSSFPGANSALHAARRQPSRQPADIRAQPSGFAARATRCCRRTRSCQPISC